MTLVFHEDEAVEYGLNEAIVLNQMRYWHTIFKRQGQPDRWIYNTYQDWQVQFPFMSDSTVRRTIAKLEKLGLVVSKIAETSTGKVCKHYRAVKMTPGSQSEQGGVVNLNRGGGQNEQLIYKEHETTHKTTTKTTLSPELTLTAEQRELITIATEIQQIITSASIGRPPKNDPLQTCVILEQMIRLDGIPRSELIPLARWIMDDPFWKTVATSVSRWRDRKGKDGVSKGLQCYGKMMLERAGPASRQSRKLPDESAYRDL